MRPGPQRGHSPQVSQLMRGSSLDTHAKEGAALGQTHYLLGSGGLERSAGRLGRPRQRLDCIARAEPFTLV